jgi:hypothetical protein
MAGVMLVVAVVVMVAAPPLSSNITKSGTIAAAPELCNCDGKNKSV